MSQVIPMIPMVTDEDKSTRHTTQHSYKKDDGSSRQRKRSISEQSFLKKVTGKGRETKDSYGVSFSDSTKKQPQQQRSRRRAYASIQDLESDLDTVSLDTPIDTWSIPSTVKRRRRHAIIPDGTVPYTEGNSPLPLSSPSQDIKHCSLYSAFESFSFPFKADDCPTDKLFTFSLDSSLEQDKTSTGATVSGTDK